MSAAPSAADGSPPLPLAGWRVLVPRPAGRATELVDALFRAGAEPVTVPLVSIEPPADGGDLDLALVELARGEFDWVGFTSVNAVDAVVQRAAELALEPVVPADTRVAAVGPSTAAALRKARLPVDLVPTAGGSAAALAEVWPHPPGPAAVLLPRSDLAPPDLPDALQGKGYHVRAVTAYRTVTCPVPASVSSELADGGYDTVLLTSPSTVTALAGIDIAASTVLGAIGRPTSKAAAAAGRPVQFAAGRPTATGLVDSLVEFALAHHRQPRARET